MKLITSTAIAICLGATSLTAQADSRSYKREQLVTYADVISVSPIYREVSLQRPKRECWIEETQHVIRYEGQDPYRGQRNRRQSANSRTGDVLIGTVIGGVIGNQLGRKAGRGGRTGATVAGAIIGSALASESAAASQRHRRQSEPRYERQPVYETRPVKRCENTTETHYEQRLQGYDVTYRYRGETFTTRMNRDPGNRIKLQVTIRPVG